MVQNKEEVENSGFQESAFETSELLFQSFRIPPLLISKNSAGDKSWRNLQTDSEIF